MVIKTAEFYGTKYAAPFLMKNFLLISKDVCQILSIKDEGRK